MFESPEELLRKIRLGEDTSLELKTVHFKGGKVSGPKRSDLADEIASMGNAQGGAIIIGVDDKSKDIIGVPLDKLDIVESFVSEICSDSITPPPMMHTFRLELPDSAGIMRAVLKIDIPRSLFVHESPGGYFYRQGSSKRKIAPDFLARLFQQKSQTRLIRFDEQAVPHSSVDDLSEKLWRRFLRRSNEPDEIVLLKRGILANLENGAVHPSVAGVLLCSEHPEKYLPNAYIEAVRYRGVKPDSNYQTDAKKITGPLDEQIDQALSFLNKNQTVEARKAPHRIEQPQFSERAVFEAVVNAAAHRDYSIHGSKIRFFMFDDRLEIYSPGALPNTVTIESIAMRQATRNELITGLLSDISIPDGIANVNRKYYMEKRGEGVPIIIDESERLSGKKPVYKLIDDSELLLAIFS